MVETRPQEQSRMGALRLYYFIFIGAGGFLFPFLNLFYERQGLSGLQMGWLGAIGSVTGLLAAPLIGKISDALAQPRRLLQAALIAAAGIYLAIGMQRHFYSIAILTVFAAISTAGVEPISTLLALHPSRSGKRAGFGSIRVWGSLGWAVMVLLAGYLVETYGLRTAFWGFAMMFAASALALNLVASDARRDNSAQTPAARGSGVRKIFKDRAMIALGISLVLLWLTRSGIWQFQNLYLDQLGAGETLIGLASMIGSVVELPGMLWADGIAGRHGAPRLLQITLLLYAFMAAAVLALPSLATIISMEAVGGLAYSFLTVSIIVFIGERSPAGQTTTTLALFTVTLPGLVTFFGAPLNGMVYDRFGAYWLYALTAAGCLLAWAVLYRMVPGGRRQVLMA